MKTVPLFEKWSGDKAEETNLNFGNGRSIAVAHRSYRKAQTPFQVSLTIKFFADLQTPGSTQRPRSTRIGNVCTLERNLQHKVTVTRSLQI